MSRLSFGALLFLALTAFQRASIEAATVVNGSFEDPAVEFLLMGFDPGETIGTGWVVDGLSDSSSVVLFRSGALGAPVTNDGGQFLLIGAGNPDFATIRQDLTLEAASYRLSFDLADGDGAAPINAVNLDITRSGQTIIGGPQNFSVGLSSGFETQELLFVAPTAGDYRLIVSATAGTPGIDAFSVTEIAAVPEPCGFAAISFAFIGLVLRRRTRT